MRLSKAWLVASKDLAIFRWKRSILYSLVIVPILEINLIPLGNTTNLLIIAGVMAAIDVLLLPLARATLSREQILTKWR